MKMFLNGLRPPPRLREAARQPLCFFLIATLRLHERVSQMLFPREEHQVQEIILAAFARQLLEATIIQVYGRPV